MVAALQSPGPRPELAEHLQLFGQFVGSWDLDRTSYAPDGTTATVPGEWHFGWVLTVAPFKTSGSVPRAGSATNPSPPPGEWGTQPYDAHRCLASHRAVPVSGAMYSFIAGCR